jgi:hypothetical protein
MDGNERGSNRRSFPAAADAPPYRSPPPPGAAAADARAARTNRLLNEGYVARDFATADAISAVIGGDRVSPAGARVYLRSFHRDAGDPTDPVERILLEQLAMAHQRLIQLYGLLAQATDPVHVKIYNDIAVRLLAEVRKLALGIGQYRAPVGGRNIPVVHQQNVVVAGGAGGQQVTSVDRTKADHERVTVAAGGEPQGKERHVDETRYGIAPEEPETRGRRAAERVEAPALVGRGPGAAAAAVPGPPAVAGLDRAEDGGGPVAVGAERPAAPARPGVGAERESVRGRRAADDRPDEAVDRVAGRRLIPPHAPSRTPASAPGPLKSKPGPALVTTRAAATTKAARRRRRQRP